STSPATGTSRPNAFGGGKRSVFGNKSKPSRPVLSGNNSGGQRPAPRTNVKPPITNVSMDQLDKAIEGVDNVETLPESDLPFEQEPTGNGPLSLNEIVKQADEIEITDLEDGEIEL